MADTIERIVIVGASLAGLRAAQTLRDEGFRGSLTVIGAETHAPYTRPPLSKQVLLGAWGPEQTMLENPQTLSGVADWRFGVRAASLDTGRRELVLDDGQRLRYDRLLVATGAAPRTLPGTRPLRGLHTLRTLDDCLAIRAGLESGPKVAVVGGGFIGAEVAATLRTRGLSVTLIEALAAPMERAVGRDVGGAFAELHRRHGVEVHVGVGVSGFESGDEGQVRGVRLVDGRFVEAELVVVGIGVSPETGWLEGSGLLLRDGLVCDATCRAFPPEIYAAGDVARWYNRRFQTEMRVEHWTNAVEQGMAAARNMLAPPDEGLAFEPVPYVWSDQYDLSLRFAGHREPGGDMAVVAGSLESLQFTVAYGHLGRVTAVLTFGTPMSHLNFYRRLIEAGASWTEALAGQPA